MELIKLLFMLVLLLLGGCQVTPEVSQEMTIHTEQQRKVAMQAYQQGDYHLAQGVLRRLAEPPISDPQAPCYLGSIYFRQHEYEAALRSFGSCRQQQPEQLEIWFNSAAIHLRLASELLLTGRSYAAQDVDASETELQENYSLLLEALLQLQRTSQSEIVRQ
ncbi:tetratricopeptide repeat protein [Pseudidiomarina halophila]|uniref:Tetratricopeptide repeat protein n=1 Tax=Pseudidiomarina halophila TaxID=1449799 RepID=A0A432XRN7_9GAMM|nr:hypothetical protein [Pseudidiomarina halophila]RUO51377.1 hypothetical protein CWI69_11870 [Pseudidiomarina halophila]